jgi:hypothetical protein
MSFSFDDPVVSLAAAAGQDGVGVEGPQALEGAGLEAGVLEAGGSGPALMPPDDVLVPPCKEADRCQPPLPEDQVEKVAASVAKYEPADSIPVPIEEKLAGMEFPVPVPASQLVAGGEEGDWIWEGYLARGNFTLLSAWCKSGKTTLLSLLLGMMESGGTFCGQAVRAAKVLVVSEEPQALWVERRDLLGLADHVRFITRSNPPFMGKASHSQWGQFIEYLAEIVRRDGIEVIVLDTLFQFWPARDENDAAEVIRTLTPLQRLTEAGAAVLLVAHVRKSEGQQGTATRGSGALPGAVDIIMELRRLDGPNNKDRRRLIETYSRYTRTPAELVIELSDDGKSYLVHGDREAIRKAGRCKAIGAVLPAQPPGLTAEEIQNAWPDGMPRPALRTLQEALKDGTAAGGPWRRKGQGKRGDPYRFWKAGGED